jgi:hypothetical protein
MEPAAEEIFNARHRHPENKSSGAMPRALMFSRPEG